MRGKSDNASFVDDLQHNKKYYYTFRSQDVHGHVSNPSNIYEVELIKHNEAAYLEVKIVQPKNIEKTKKQKRQKGHNYKKETQARLQKSKRPSSAPLSY